MNRWRSPWRRAALLVAVLAVMPAQAERETRLNLGLAYVAPDSARGASHGLGGNVGYAVRLARPLWLEGRLFANVLQADDATDAGGHSQQGLGLDALVPLGTLAAGEPFVLVGGGIVHNDVRPDSLDATGAFANAGFGWRSRPVRSDEPRYRLELRASHDRFGGGQTDLLVGLLVELGRADAAPPVVSAAVPPTIVRLAPPAAPPVATAPVADEDGDGIPDASDRCARSLAGAKVEPDGCVRRDQVVTTGDVRFASGSATLTQDSYATLDKMVGFFAQQPEVTMDIFGHTDAQGDEAYNLALSNYRAAAVRRYLIEHGVAAARVKAQGFGETRPVDTNDTEAGRARNRRVELHIHTGQPR